MSAERSWTLTCDGCGEIFDSGFNPTAKECRQIARYYGWATGVGRHRNDFCPECKDATND